MWLLLAVLVAADTPPIVKWANGVERDAVKLKTTAKQLSDTAAATAADGRISRLAPLRSDVEDVVQRAEVLVRVSNEDLPK